MNARSLFSLGALALLLNPGFSGSVKTDDPKNIQGMWTLVSVEGPEKIPPEELKKLRIRITADRLIIQLKEKEINSSSFKLNPSKNPKEIDLVVTVLIDKKTVIVCDSQPRQGIYELTGGDLKICVAWATGKIAPDPSTRPKEFKTGGDLSVMILKRDK